MDAMSKSDQSGTLMAITHHREHSDLGFTDLGLSPVNICAAYSIYVIRINEGRGRGTYNSFAKKKKTQSNVGYHFWCICNFLNFTCCGTHTYYEMLGMYFFSQHFFQVIFLFDLSVLFSKQRTKYGLKCA